MMNEALEKSFRLKWAIRIKTKHPDGDAYDGVVLNNGKALVVLHEEGSFELDGIQVLPRKFIKSVRDGKNEICSNAILRMNDQIRSLDRTKWIRGLQTVKGTIEQLQKRDIWPAVETVKDHASALYIGPILNSAQHSFRLRCYDAEGQWEDEYTIRYGEVFRIEFWSAYTTNFNEYMGASNQQTQPIAGKPGSG